MDPVIIIFVMATGSVAIAAILPIIFWLMEGGPNTLSIPSSRQAIRKPGFKVKSPPPAAGQQFYWTNLPAQASC